MHPRTLEVSKRVLETLELYSHEVVRRPLYDYQLAPARAIVASVLGRQGLELAVLFPRQSGKNETQAQVEAYLLNRYSNILGASIVKAQPTYTPQALNARDRLERILENKFDRDRWRREDSHHLRLGQARMAFFSAARRANVAGATASLLLACDEAQDVLETVWDRKFLPMAASTNATVVYWGTAWTNRTLLARAIRRLRALEQVDGQRRVFVASPDEVRRANSAYGAFVDRVVAAKGRNHPSVRTQYFNEELDAEAGMFTAARQVLMRGRHARQTEPAPGGVYALLLDVAGQAETGPDSDERADPRRDATVLTIVEVDLATLADPLIAAPTYRAVDRRIWRGVRHTALYAEIRALALHWRARYLVADATGIGAGLAAFLEKALRPGTTIPFVFNAATKSKLGWDFLALCDAGRWQDYAAGAGDAASLTFWSELNHCQYEVLPGPAHALRWGVPDGTVDEFGELVHDDTVISAALAAVLDEQPWHVSTGPALIIRGKDPLEEMSHGY
jgi:hypothetical protein